jgi:hypothetical protein
VGRAQLGQDAPTGLVTAPPLAQLSQLGQGRVGATPAIKQAVDFFHDRPECTQLGQAARDGLQRPPFSWSQVVLDKQVALRKERPNFLLYSCPVADSALGRKRGWTPAF